MPIARKTATPTADDYTPKGRPAPDFAPEGAEESEVFEEESFESTRIPVKARAGWDAADEVQKKVKSLGDFFTPTEDPALICFVQGAPFDSYLVHWVDTKDGRRSFRCADEDGDCALCEIGDSPAAKFAFWVVEFTIKEEQVDYDTRVWEVGTKLKNTLKDMNAEPRKGGPLDGNFFSAHRTGKKQTTQYHVSRVKDRDLEEDWGLSAADGRKAVEELAAKGEPRLFIPNIEDVEAAAAYMKRHG
jgi:hypothetical protein